MSAKKALKIICLVFAGLLVIVFAYLWSMGVFSGSFSSGERNTVMEEAVEDWLCERLSEAYSKEGAFKNKTVKLLNVSSAVAMFESDFPKDKFPSKEKITEEDILKAIKFNPNNVTFELKFQGEKLEFNPYKVVAYEIENILFEELNIRPLTVQIFYYREPSGDEKESVMQYESHISNYLIGQDQKTVVNASDTHAIVEVTGSLATKAKIYFTTKTIYIIVVSVTVVALTILLIIRTIKKKRRYKNSRHIDDI